MIEKSRQVAIKLLRDEERRLENAVNRSETWRNNGPYIFKGDELEKIKQKKRDQAGKDRIRLMDVRRAIEDITNA